MIANLPTPAEQSALEELNNIDLARLAYEQLGTSIISQGEVLRRFRHLNTDFREVEKDRDAHAEKSCKLSSEHEDVCRRFEACATERKHFWRKWKSWEGRKRFGWIQKLGNQKR